MWLDAFDLRIRLKPNGGVYSNQTVHQDCNFEKTTTKTKVEKCETFENDRSAKAINTSMLQGLLHLYIVGISSAFLVLLLELALPNSNL